jgi:putative transposase
VWTWDMSFLPTQVLGVWCYMYLILDIYSRKIVGFEVHETDDSEHAVELLRRTALAEGLHSMAQKPVLHGDNGSTLKATTVLAMIYWLGLKSSYSRPRVSNDNAFSESLFRTAKYRPEFPAKGFADLEQARLWARSFVDWYNNDHKHSGIRYVSPHNVTPARIATSWRLDTECMSRRSRLTRGVGRVTRETGIRSRSLRSVPNAIL